MTQAAAFERKALQWSWTVGQLLLVVWVVALVPGFLSHMQRHDRAQALSIAHGIWVLAALWALWFLGGLVWSQEFHKDGAAKP